MYQRILVPTDGSSSAVAAALHAVSLAARMNAELFILQVIPPYRLPIYLEYGPANLYTEEEYLRQCQEGSDRHLAMLAAQADAANVKSVGKAVFQSDVAQAIVDEASALACQLIVMGSHGRSGFGRLFLGSVTARVLPLSHVPVLVHRAAAGELATAEDVLAGPSASGAAAT
jgi:nucleotide-binding universal stress UspA family protein